jgi:hypothetical protein
MRSESRDARYKRNGPHVNVRAVSLKVMLFTFSGWWDYYLLLSPATAAKSKCQPSKSGEQHQATGRQYDSAVLRSGRSTGTRFRCTGRN